MFPVKSATVASLANAINYTTVALIFRQNSSYSATDSACFYTFFRSRVVLSHLCHLLRFRCHLAGTVAGPIAHCVILGSFKGQEKIVDEPSAKTRRPTDNCRLQQNRQFYAATCRIQTNNSSLCQITLDFIF